MIIFLKNSTNIFYNNGENSRALIGSCLLSVRVQTIKTDVICNAILPRVVDKFYESVVP